MNNMQWPTAGLAYGSQISGLVIDLCGKARGANWISKDFHSTAKCLCKFFVNQYRFFF